MYQRYYQSWFSQPRGGAERAEEKDRRRVRVGVIKPYFISAIPASPRLRENLCMKLYGQLNG